MRTRWIWLLLSAAPPALAPQAAAADRDRPAWSFETGVLAGHNTNYFHRADDPGTDAPSADLATIYISGLVSIDLGRQDLNLKLDAGGDFIRDIEGADNQQGNLEIEYRRPMTRVSGAYFMNPNRLYSESGEGEFYDLSGFEADLRQALGGGVWIGAGYEAETWTFSAEESDRDADSTELSLTLRFPLGGRVGARLAGMREEKTARAPEHSWTGQGYAVSVEASSRRGTQLFVRYRQRDRAYEEAPPDNSNFERDDVIQDYLLSLRLPVSARWGFRTEHAYRRGKSTRLDRNYDVLQVSGGVYWRF